MKMWKCLGISSLAFIFYARHNENWLDGNFSAAATLLSDRKIAIGVTRIMAKQCCSFWNFRRWFKHSRELKFQFAERLKLNSAQSNFHRDLFQITWHHLAININFKSWNNPSFRYNLRLCHDNSRIIHLHNVSPLGKQSELMRVSEKLTRAICALGQRRFSGRGKTEMVMKIYS